MRRITRLNALENRAGPCEKGGSYGVFNTEGKAGLDQGRKPKGEDKVIF